jgi:hypothetical protein
VVRDLAERVKARARDLERFVTCEVISTFLRAKALRVEKVAPLERVKARVRAAPRVMESEGLSLFLLNEFFFCCVVSV